MDDKENRIDSELSKLSPFELKNRIIALADESVKKDAHVMLNAGRGNPNWIADRKSTRLNSSHRG